MVSHSVTFAFLVAIHFLVGLPYSGVKIEIGSYFVNGASHTRGKKIFLGVFIIKNTKLVGKAFPRIR